jgi:hypothetical protein
MVFQALSQEAAESLWRPFLDELTAAGAEIAITQPLTVLALPARQFWSPDQLKQVPGLVLADDRPSAPASNIFWAGNREEAGQVLHAYRSLWLPAALLSSEARGALAEALFAASRHWSVALHLNKGLAGAPEEAIAAARDTAMNPAALDAFALLICGAEGPPAYPGIAGHEPDASAARRDAGAIERAMGEITGKLPAAGSYVAESNFFEPAWQSSSWGANYARLSAAKRAYDPDGLFVVHHGVGSEAWSPDGFTRLG